MLYFPVHVRFLPSADLSLCASFRVRFFLMRLYTDALFSGALFSYVLFSSALLSGHHFNIIRDGQNHHMLMILKSKSNHLTKGEIQIKIILEVVI